MVLRQSLKNLMLMSYTKYEKFFNLLNILADYSIIYLTMYGGEEYVRFLWFYRKP